jgi:hypothetical protein
MLNDATDKNCGLKALSTTYTLVNAEGSFYVDHTNRLWARWERENELVFTTQTRRLGMSKNYRHCGTRNFASRGREGRALEQERVASWVCRVRQAEG